MTNEIVIRIEKLRKNFGAVHAVEEVDLEVRRGSVFGFLGPNGAGKTTSLKMLLGLVEPTAGTGRVLGAPLGDRKARARLGFLPEHFRFQDWLTGRELLRFHGRLLGMGGGPLDARVDALLARVDLLDAAHRPIRTYSKGMTQRVGLAQALLNQPDVVFLDEPTSGLDPLGRLLVRDVIHELRDRGTTVFLNSHLLGEVEATCTRVVFLKAGRAVHEMRLDDPDRGVDVELRTGPIAGDALEALAGIGRFDADRPREASGGGDAPGSAAGATAAGAHATLTRLRVTNESALPEIARLLVRHGVPVYGIRVARKSLEAWFLEVMGEESRPG
jgi:ABC-2 type transport system ATP-binding protein